MKWSSSVVAFSFCTALFVTACGTAGLGLSPLGGGEGGVGVDGGKVSGDATTGSGKDGGSGTGSGGGGSLLHDGGGGTTVCVPATCTELNVNCGPQGDGCGGIIQCGTCKSPQTCGGGTAPSVCGGNNSCTPKTCPADACGPVSDGCGGLLQCGACTAPKTCGGGGTPSVCGGDNGCAPTTCMAAGVNCGPIGDGCGGLLQCGGCGSPQTCGGGGKPGVCGDGLKDGGTDGGIHCTPTTCNAEHINCGPAGNGCGGELQCGTCSAPETCGGGATPGQCGGNAGCVPKNCAELGVSCGPAGDGCGNEITTCGSCTAPATCGGGGTPGKCGGDNNCVPKTCTQLGYNCGFAGDGCGGLLNCGSTTCPSGEVCGGGGKANVCGGVDAGGATCTNLCLKQTTCSNPNVTTTVTGTVYAPNGQDPLYNALVYIPNATPTAFTRGVTCDQCSTDVTGSPLVSTTTAPDGTFELQNVPVGTNIPLVIQLGRWRRETTIPSTTACTNTALPACTGATNCLTNLPSCHTGNASCPAGEALGDIPWMAFVTGSVDSLECVIQKIGVDSSEFTSASGTGRINLFVGDATTSATHNGMTTTTYYGGASAPGPDSGVAAESETNLVNSLSAMETYDMILFPCQGTEDQNAIDQAQLTNLVNYANAGGRVFATHYSYVWMIDNTSGSDPGTTTFSGTANWSPNKDTGVADQTGYVNTSFAKGQALAQWLQVVGATTTYAQIPLTTLREDTTWKNAGGTVTDGVVSPTLEWMSVDDSTDGDILMHMTFDTPIGNAPANQCGRVLFDDFHVENNGGDNGDIFPGECPAAGTAMTAQEHLLEFMLFDLDSCILTTTTTPPSCTPKTCTQEGFNCGPETDGCGNEIQCGTCPTGETCGGGGTPGVCGGMTCPQTTCVSQGIQCGPTGNGCGGLLQCGNCPNGETCGGGGVPGQCGAPTCTPITCSSQGIHCGPAGNGCGGLLDCGNCPSGEVCGGGGVPGVCGAPDASTCIPQSCQTQGIQCGPAGNGCGGQLACGTCPTGETCGGGGMPGICGAPMCTQTTCMAQGISCGPAGDGCGGELQCGTCPPNETCGGGGTPGVCGSECKPKTCAELNLDCGPAGDGCGGLLECGTCTAPDTCGGAGIAGQCGSSMIK